MAALDAVQKPQVRYLPHAFNRVATCNRKQQAKSCNLDTVEKSQRAHQLESM